MNTPTDMQPASVWRRAAARVVDGLMMASIGCVTMVVVWALPVAILRSLDSVLATLVLLLLLGSAVAACYEVVPTARRGQTFGKAGMGIQVVRCDEQGAPIGDMQPPDLRQCVERWVMPHGIGTLVAIVLLPVIIPKMGSYGLLVGAGAAAAAWLLAYAPSPFDKNRRGWHDKAARTMVVTAPDPHPQQ